LAEDDERAAWCSSPARSGMDDEDWAANPWQAEADAHIMQLQQAGSTGSIFPHMQGSRIGGVAQAGVTVVTPEQLLRRNYDLEGQVALLEDLVTRRERELAEEVQQRLQLESSVSHDSSPQRPRTAEEVRGEDLERKNNFLSVVVARFEKKTMQLEEEIVALTLAKQAAEARAAGVMDLSGRFALEGGGRSSQASSLADVATQAQDDLILRVNDLEGQMALLEEAVVGKDTELEVLRARVEAAEAEASSRSACRIPDHTVELEELRQRSEFLSGVVSRFEKKTMGLQEELDAQVVRGQEAIAKQAAAHQEELRAARDEAAKLLAARQAAEAQAAELAAAKAETAERLAEQREATESANLAMRDLKKEHNRKMQDLLRRIQILEKKRHDLDMEKRQLESASTTAAAPAGAAPGGSTEVEQPVMGLEEQDEQQFREVKDLEKELRESKELNAQLIDRLARERSKHTESAKNMEAIMHDNGVMSSRVNQLTEQLFTLVEMNDHLNEKLASQDAGGSSGGAGGAYRLATVSEETDCLDTMS